MEEAICIPHSLSNSDLETYMHKNDKVVGYSTKEFTILPMGRKVQRYRGFAAECRGDGYR